MDEKRTHARTHRQQAHPNNPISLFTKEGMLKHTVFLYIFMFIRSRVNGVCYHARSNITPCLIALYIHCFNKFRWFAKPSFTLHDALRWSPFNTTAAIKLLPSHCSWRRGKLVRNMVHHFKHQRRCAEP